MLEGNRFLPETGTPIRKIACMIRPLALAEPVPLTLASLIAKSFMRLRIVWLGPAYRHKKSTARTSAYPRLPWDNVRRRDRNERKDLRPLTSAGPCAAAAMTRKAPGP